MEEETPAKRRKTDNSEGASTDGRITKQWSGNVEISTLSVKPDKFQKLRRIATSCTEKIQQPKTDDVILSSAGSSSSSSPRPENLIAISNPVDPAELHARLTVLVREEDKENKAKMLGGKNMQVENLKVGEQRDASISNGKNFSVGENSEKDAGKKASADKNVPINTEQCYVLLTKLLNEKMKELEDTYTSTIIPSLEKKIADLESENKCLQDHAKKLEVLVKEGTTKNLKQVEKPVQCHVGVQTSFIEPPPLTPAVSLTSTSKNAPVVHIVDAVPSLPSITRPQAQVTMAAMNGQNMVKAVAIADGVKHTATLTGQIVTTTAGQPRLFSDAPFKPGSHQNPVPRSHSYARPNAPITATVYPQPQNRQTSPSTLSAHQNSPRNQSPPSRVPYNPPVANPVMVRGTRPLAQYVATIPERQENPTVVNFVRPKTGPPPPYSVAAARPQHQVSYCPGSATNLGQTTVRQYTVRQSAPPSITPPAAGVTQILRPAGPPPLVRAQSNIHQRPQVNAPPRYQNSAQSNVVHQPPQYSQATPAYPDPNRTQPVAVQPRHHVPATTTPVQNGTTIQRDLPPPTPTVSISGASNGIVLSWTMTIPEGCAPIDSYQLFAYQNSPNMANTPSLWKKLGIVKALPLPMACTLTQFVSGSMYYFAVRAIDIHGRAGTYSSPCAISLPKEDEKGRA